MVDPKVEATPVGNALVEALSGNAVCVLDAPCGSGAAFLALLTGVAELRAAGTLPRLPLDVTVLGAEPAESARSYAAELLEFARPFLEAQAIFVRDRAIMHWDVLDAAVNADLIQRLLEVAKPPIKRLCVVANFSAFLNSAGKRKEALPQIESLFLHASRGGAVAVWIEPQVNEAVAGGGLFTSVAKRFVRWISGRASDGSEQPSPVFTTASNFVPAMRKGTSIVRLAVIRFDLQRS
jgi:hypothetical protein